MKKLSLLFAFVASASVSHAATVSTGLGLNIDTFPGTGTIVGPSFTDSIGNVLTLGSSFFISSGVWFGAGDLTATFVSPVNEVGFTFVSLGGPSTTIDSVTLSNGDSYNIQTSLSSGGFFGVSSATGFTTAIFHEQQFSSFGISDFRFGTTAVVPESGTFGLVGSALLAVYCALKRRVDRG